MIDAPEPLIPATADLRAFPYSPIFRARLFGSSFHARATDSEWRAGVTLWLKSWDQVPAGSLPSDDVDLCRLAELGRDTKAWKKIRAGALHGWIECSDGRLYHKVVAEGVLEALTAKEAQRDRTARARLAALQKRLAAATDEASKAHITDEINRLSQSLPQKIEITSTDGASASVTDSVTESKRREEKGEGSEQRGKGLGLPPSADATGGDLLPPASPPAREERPPEVETALQAACKATWSAYCKAYTDKYGAAPIRDAKANTAIKAFVQSVGHDAAPDVARFYLTHGDAFYVRQCHPPGLLQKDAAKLHTEWVTGNKMTATRAMQSDRTSANLASHNGALALLEAKGLA